MLSFAASLLLFILSKEGRQEFLAIGMLIIASVGAGYRFTAYMLGDVISALGLTSIIYSSTFVFILSAVIGSAIASFVNMQLERAS